MRDGRRHSVRNREQSMQNGERCGKQNCERGGGQNCERDRGQDTGRSRGHENRLGRRLGSLLLALAVLVCSAGVPAESLAASGDPVLRFDLSSDGPATGLKAGDSVLVKAEVSRSDMPSSAYDLYAVQLDISYDKELFELSQPAGCGLKRPDGQNWIGGWSCSAVPGVSSSGLVRVLYTNIGGLISRPPKLDTVSGELTAASFRLTAKKDAPGEVSPVKIVFSETTGSDWNKSSNIKGNNLSLSFAGSSSGSGADSDSNGDHSNSGGDTGSGGSGSGSGSGDADSGDGGGSGSGSGESGNGSGSGNNSDSGNSGGQNGGNSGSSGSGGSGSGGSGSGSGAGSAAGGASGSTTNGSGTSGQGAGTKNSVSFSELTDVPADHWAADSIRFLVERGIAAGNEKREFQPDQSVTRAEFCQMISSAFGYAPAKNQVLFSDVSPEDWYYGPVMALYEAGVVAGTGDGAFGAAETLSRQDMALMLYRVMKDRGVNLTMKREYGEFTDANQVEDYARQAVMDLYCTEIISGTAEHTLSPQDDSTRAQIAAVLSKIVKESEGRR